MVFSFELGKEEFSCPAKLRFQNMFLFYPGKKVVTFPHALLGIIIKERPTILLPAT